MAFFADVVRTVSDELLPVLRTLLECCEELIVEWIPESELQWIIRSGYPLDVPLGQHERNAFSFEIAVLQRAAQAL